MVIIYSFIVINKYIFIMNININYGTSYLLNINNLERNIKDLNVGIYDLSGINIIVKQNILYDLTHINKNSKLIPILYPSINEGLFYIDISNENINIDSSNGIINLNNLDINIYSFNVIWILNSVISSYYINFTIKPEFYYEPNELIILYNETKQSNLPIIIPNNNYIINSKYKISSSGIINFINYDVGYHIIPVTLTMNNILVTTNYNLFVLPEIKYLLDIYTCNSYNEFITDKPFVSQIGGLFQISNNDYFYIDSNTGIIKINGPINLYNLEISYTKNNVINKCNIIVIIKPNIIYNDLLPYSNESINGIFEIIDIKYYNNIIIDISSGLITYNNLYPNIYTIKIKYTPYINNLCNTESICKLIINPKLNILSKNQVINFGNYFENVYFETFPDNELNIFVNNPAILIKDNYLDLNNIKNIGIYNIQLCITVNKLTDYKDYSFTILPTIKYNINNFCYYKESFNSELPIIKPDLAEIKIFSGNNVNSDNGIVYFNNLNVGEYNSVVYLNYANFDISVNFNLIVKPILIIPSQNIFYSNSISGIIYLPKGGTLLYNNQSNIVFNNLIKEIKNLNAGIYNYSFSYKFNNIETKINSIFHILKKQLILKYFIKDKYYDGLKIVNIVTDISDIIINSEFYNANVELNKEIIINDIFLPNYLDINYYVNKIKLKGNIYQQKIIPNTIISDKIYDGTLFSYITISHNLVNIKSYDSLYVCQNVGLQTINIKNIVIDNLNYQVYDYTISAYILPKKVYISFLGQDKIFDDTSNCNIIFKNIDGLINKDKIYIKNIYAIFNNYNIGYNEISIINYELYGINYDNYEIIFNKIYANIFPKKIFLDSIINEKIYDSTSCVNLSLKSIDNLKILSYDANFIDKKKIIVKNIILENKNYYVDDFILYSNIKPRPLDFYYYGDNKVYDGNSFSFGKYTINSISGDDINCIYDANFENINSGNNKDLIISNIKLYGKDANNYIIKNIITNKSCIYRKEIFIDFNCIDKMYDKTNKAFVEIKSISGILLCDKNLDFKILSLDANYEDFFSGKNKNIFINNIVFVPSIINYYCNNTKCIGNILPREIILDINVNDKIYDGNINSNININNINNIIYNDSVYIKSLNSNFIDSNVGNNKIIKITDIKLFGSLADNYICNNFTFFGNILPKNININFKAEEQEYNDNLIPKLIINSLEIVKSYNTFYKQINVGIQDVIITNITLSDSINYIVNDQIIKGIILPKKININFSAKDKIYDGSNNVIILYDNNLVLSFDAYFEDVNVGYKKIFINNIKINNSNYITNENIIIYGNILPCELFINPIISKIYDGNNNYILIDNKILSSLCNFEQINIGENIKVNIKNIILKDNNYVINDFETIGNIKPKIIEPIFIIEDKIYNCNNKVNIKNIKSEISIKSYNAYYINNNIGLQKVIIDNIIFNDFNYISNPIYLESNIKPLKLEIEFIILPKKYNNNNNNAIIESYNILNTNENINILSYNANYEDINVGNQKIIINNIIIDSENFITDTYISYGIIIPILLDIKCINLDKIYDKNNNTNLIIKSNEDIQIIFDSLYNTCNVSNKIEIEVFNIKLNNSNYYLNNFKLIGKILPKEINCYFKFVNNVIVGNLIGIINNDDVYINNYISYSKNNETYIQNIILGGNNKNDYKILDNIYKVLSN